MAIANVKVGVGCCQIELEVTDAVRGIDETEDIVALAQLNQVLPWHHDAGQGDDEVKDGHFEAFDTFEGLFESFQDERVRYWIVQWYFVRDNLPVGIVDEKLDGVAARSIDCGKVEDAIRIGRVVKRSKDGIDSRRGILHKCNVFSICMNELANLFTHCLELFRKVDSHKDVGTLFNFCTVSICGISNDYWVCAEAAVI